MKRIAAALLCLMVGVSFAQPKSDLEEVKQRALETVTAFQKISPDLGIPDWPKGRKCRVTPQSVYAGKPFIIHSLIHPTEDDLARLRRRIKAAQQENLRFEADVRRSVREARLGYRDHYEVPIFHRVCGYMFHVQPGELGWEIFKPINVNEAQRLLGVEVPPIFVSTSSLSILRDGYMWISGSRAVDAFHPKKRYKIVDRKGKLVIPSETRLAPLISRESIGWPDGTPSAYWGFQLPIRFEPLTSKP